MENLSYEQAFQELEKILSDLKENSITIDQLENKVDRAATLAVFCSQKLRTTESRITEIIKNLNL